MISYNIIYNVAFDIVKKRKENGFMINPDDTVCVLCTGTGNIYTGISGLETINGMTNYFHAEIDAITNMRNHNELVIESVSVFNASSLSPILPCNGCISCILSLAPENQGTVIITPNGNIRITEVGRYVQGAFAQPQYYQPGFAPNQSVYGYSNPASVYMNAPNSAMMQNSQMAPGSQMMPGSRMIQNTVNNQSENNSSYLPKRQESAGGELLKNKLSGLLGDDDDDIEEDLQKKKKKKGLFR